MDSKEFAMKMEAISRHPDSLYYDDEDRHIDMDNLMCELLISLGYNEGIDIFKNTHKWYC